MSISLKGSDTSTYASPITLGSDAPASQGSTYYSTSVDIRRDDGGAVYNVFRDGAGLSNRTIILNSDGSASFAGGKFTISDKGNISRVGTGGNYYNLGAFNNSGTTSGATGGRLNLFTDDPDGTPDVQTIALNGLDGSATFAGNATIGTFDETTTTSKGTRIGIFTNNSAVQTQCLASASSDNGVYEVWHGDQKNINFTVGGNATFAGAVLSPNACTAWVNFSGANATFRDQYNIGNITRVEAGRYSIPFTTPMDNSNYCIQVSSNQVMTVIDSMDANGFQMSVFDSGGSRVDTTIICATVFGGKN